MIRVLVVDDNTFVRISLAALLSTVEGLEVVGECADGADVDAAVTANRPDVVLMDHAMPHRSGVQACAALRLSHPSIRVVIFTACRSSQIRDEAEQAGAAGFLVKDGDSELLVRAVREAAKVDLSLNNRQARIRSSRGSAA